jgi:hypothetical protein
MPTGRGPVFGAFSTSAHLLSSLVLGVEANAYLEMYEFRLQAKNMRQTRQFCQIRDAFHLMAL